MNKSLDNRTGLDQSLMPVTAKQSRAPVLTPRGLFFAPEGLWADARVMLWAQSRAVMGFRRPSIVGFLGGAGRESSSRGHTLLEDSATKVYFRCKWGGRSSSASCVEQWQLRRWHRTDYTPYMLEVSFEAFVSVRYTVL